MFSEVLNQVIRAFPPRPAALPEMATAVVILDEDRHIEYVNTSAEALFTPIDPVGATLPDLFESCSAEGGDDLFASIDASDNPAPTRIRLSDERLLDGVVRKLSSGGFVLTLDDVTSYVREAELGLRDTLTGLANRKLFTTQLIERLRRARESKQAIALLYVDLDRFKGVNDTLGHQMGDALLAKVADRFRSATRDDDLVARLGGDEFAVLQTGVEQPACAESLATRLVDLIGRAYALNGHMFHIGASIGVAVFPSDGAEPEAILKSADLALYRAKADGRGCYRFFEPAMDERIQARRLLEIDLRRALALKQLHLAYQPQVELETNQIAGFEALIRWQHPERGVVSPAEFIPLAEEMELIGPIGEWVLRTACKEAASWPRPVSIAVNLSPLQFKTTPLVEAVRKTLALSGLDPGRLELEITEGALLYDTAAVLRDLEEVQNLGVQISLDDFGTGYSSLSYLQKFPFGKIKIDQSFVRGIDRDGQRQAIVRAITDLASALGMTTTAEGVETPQELTCVRAAGCTKVQGYLTGRPMSVEAASNLLANDVTKAGAEESVR